MAPVDFRERLKEQRGFLRRSLQAFLDGDAAEAVRIATAIRILVHETKSAKPLLKQLRSDYLQIPILNHPLPTPVNPGGIILYYIGVGIQLGPDRIVRPIVDLSEPLQLGILGSWWIHPCLIFPDEQGHPFVYKRKELILTLADKEGGAHVNATLPSEYERLVTVAPLKVVTQGIETDSVNLARYVCVQSAAHIIECLERNFPWVVEK